MKTDLKLFIKNYKTMYKCVIPFTHDDLLIEKDNIYLLRKKEFGYVLYELTGLWRPKGHQGKILTTKAVYDGIRGWNIPSYYEDYFKIIGYNYLYPFLYSEM